MRDKQTPLMSRFVIFSVSLFLVKKLERGAVQAFNVPSGKMAVGSTTTAHAALDRLKEKPYKPRTSAALEEIRDMLFLHSDFDGAAQQAEVMICA